ncbi:BTB/POZ domain-containing protein [Ditylenchus destructor]|nr:BTB/POZ domain-containing protein [Ditylenchus destructor]
MTETNFSTNGDWVRLNVGGKIFQTTKDTLSRHPDSFLARLVNGELPSEKDESGAYLIDGNPEHFDTILTYLRRGVLNLDGNEKTTKDLLCEADFYNIQPLVDEIRKAMSLAKTRCEIIFLCVTYYEEQSDLCEIYCSEKHDDYEVLQVLRSKFNDIRGKDGRSWFYISGNTAMTRLDIETTLRNFGFVEEHYDPNFTMPKCNGYRTRHWKFVRTVSK